MKSDPPDPPAPAPDEDAKRAASVANSAAMIIPMVEFAFSRLQDAGGGNVGRMVMDGGAEEWRFAASWWGQRGWV